jgi:hypothetical protein
VSTPAQILFPPQRREAQPGVAHWIDVSNHQGILRPSWFEEWSERGYSGLIVQGVEGLSGESFTRRQLWAAQDAGWRIAGYVWCNADQAANLIRLRQRLDFFNGFKLDFLALDVEELDTKRHDVDASLLVCDAQLKTHTWLYTAKWVFDGLGWSDEAYWPNRKLWTAWYDGEADVDVGFEPYGGWDRCDMKQFTDKPLDLNVRRV